MYYTSAASHRVFKNIFILPEKMKNNSWRDHVFLCSLTLRVYIWYVIYTYIYVFKNTVSNWNMMVGTVPAYVRAYCLTWKRMHIML